MPFFTAAELAEHRADAEALMVDTYRAYAPAAATTGPGGYKAPGWADKGTTPGRLAGRGKDVADRTVTIGGVETTVLEGGLHIPVSAFLDPVTGRLLLAGGWELQCVAVHPDTDRAQLGRRWRVVAAPAKAYATARRLDVAEVPPVTV